MRIHFIGIGGIGISSLARYYLSENWEVSGSDLVSSEITQALEKIGAKILIGPHSKKNIAPDTSRVIYSPAVQKDNPELKEAKRLEIKCLSYPEALGELTKKYFTIAVSGAHGKSTTTAIMSLVLIEAGLDPTVVVGTKLKEFGNSNFRKGKSKYLVIEADEWGFSFLNYRPKIIILTNIDKEHLDCYKDINHIFKTFKQYIKYLPKDGLLIANGDNKNVNKLIGSFKNPRLRQGFGGQAKFKIIKYSLKQKEAVDIKKNLKIPGEHNVSNGLGVLALSRVLEIQDKTFFKAISKYQGAWRRFEEKEFRIKNKKLRMISDYGHHPTEIDATLKAAREKYSDKKIWCVFQPHQYQRTFYLFKEFIKVLKNAPVDKLIITDIYDVAGRERKDIKKEISSEKLVRAIKNNKTIYLPKNKIINFLKKELKGNEVVIIMGAGDIYDISKSLK